MLKHPLLHVCISLHSVKDRKLAFWRCDILGPHLKEKGGAFLLVDSAFCQHRDETTCKENRMSSTWARQDIPMDCLRDGTWNCICSQRRCRGCTFKGDDCSTLLQKPQTAQSHRDNRETDWRSDRHCEEFASQWEKLSRQRLFFVHIQQKVVFLIMDAELHNCGVLMTAWCAWLFSQKENKKRRKD